ncbi:CDK-activating kinase assembly factor, putative [Theileria equi strain WA]|uniref:CDK-activating kinase assembly factor, putative n=1 Tax=Theileria equi strain WA TaxID=1537102 RepID=L0AWP2_THEEQ|nr:CDK-activating kinase assembly factor, putative [Theileria equi strain WA]AFZ79431.1 CDK-activating kinase assembly factor, putative [Theileria equi strain WA]|eukprot:XP_004829097.1 CDK-activating kinase assembly factor, putative [Theileria equi strain WA]
MDTECPICLEIITPLSGKTLLVSEVCDHKICDVCAERQLASQAGHTQCAICRCHITRMSFVPFDICSIYYNSHKDARKRVLQVYNDTRINFQTTPEYNKYLEDREALIVELATCKNEVRRKTLEQEIKSYERANASRISENIAVQKAEHRKRIRSIVEKEKTFYEIVDKGAPFNPHKLQDLIHPLQKSCPSYFLDEGAVLASKGESKPLNAAIRSDSDIQRRVYTSRIEFLESDIAGGYSKDLVSTKCKMLTMATLLWNI